MARTQRLVGRRQHHVKEFRLPVDFPVKALLQFGAT